MKKTSILALLGKNVPEKLSGLSVKGGLYPPFPLRFFWQNDFPLRGWGGGYPLNGQNPLKRFWQVPLLDSDTAWVTEIESSLEVRADTFFCGQEQGWCGCGATRSGASGTTEPSCLKTWCIQTIAARTCNNRCRYADASAAADALEHKTEISGWRCVQGGEICASAWKAVVYLTLQE